MVVNPPPLTPEQRLNNAEATVNNLTNQKLSQVHFWTDAQTWSTLFAAIETEVDTFVTDEINRAIAAAPANQAELRKSYMELIKYRREKVPLKTDITDQILGICQQILGFGAAGVALTVGFLDKIQSFSVPVQKIIAVAGIFYAELIGLSLTVLVWYMLQAHFRYPFLYFDRIGNARPYFYYACISNEVARAPIQSARARFRASSLYAKDFLKFTSRSFQETPDQQVRNEFQQYFLLMAYSGYVQQFSTRLTNLFFYGLFGAIGSAALVAMTM